MKSIYLDSSVPSAYYERSERGEVTRKWWDEKIKSYKALISVLTLRELEALETEERRRALLSLVKGLPVLKMDPAAQELAASYIEKKVIPPNVPNDALHIALAVVNKVDMLLSWDFAHMVRPEVERKINVLNMMNGYSRIYILSPEKLLREKRSSLA